MSKRIILEPDNTWREETVGQEEKLGTGYLSPHFRETEFTCNHCNSMEGHEVDDDLLLILEDVREYFGSAVTVTSGYRCSTHNTNVGSSEASQHRRATAADIQISGVKPSKVYNYLDGSKWSRHIGLGKYDSFTHVDTRKNSPTPARW